jgi:lysophospholipase L1-like esterase
LPHARHPFNQFSFRFLSVVVMAATAFPACAQAPATAVPKPRDGAWLEVHNSLVSLAKQGDVDLLFLGDSITQGWHENGTWQRFYAPRKAANFGIGGDRTEHVLWRIQNGELSGIEPKLTVLLVGTNNLSDNTPDEIAQGISAIIGEIRHRLPRTKVLLLGIFPRGRRPDAVRDRIKSVNQKIAKFDDGSRVRFLDIGPAFLSDEGTITREIMPDYLHLTRHGYRIWADAMEPILWSMLDEPGADAAGNPKS